VTDLHQTKISYGILRTPAAIDDMLKGLGVTHLLWPGGTVSRDTVAGDLAFMNYAMNYAEGRTEMSGYRLANLPAQRPAEGKADFDVAYFACHEPYAPGWYRLSQLTEPVVGRTSLPVPKAPLGTMEEATQTADFIVIDACRGETRPAQGFIMGATRGRTQLWVRTQAQANR
jgi:hypothetical protein